MLGQGLGLSKSFHISLLIYILIMFIAYTLEQKQLLTGVVPVIISVAVYYLVTIQVKLVELNRT